MKISRRQLRKIIQEMAYAGHLGIIPDEDNPIYDWNNASGGLLAGLDGDLTDYDKWIEENEPEPGSKEWDEWDEDEEWDKHLNNIVKRQRLAAKAYAGSEHFKNNAEKFFGRLEANIWVLTKVGYFDDLINFSNINKNDADLNYFEKAQQFSYFRSDFFNLDQKAIDFLKSSTNDEEIKKNIDLIDFNDTVIFFSTDAVGNKSFFIKNTPWLLFHAMIHDTAMLDELKYSKEYLGFEKSEKKHSFSKDVDSILTMKTARDELEKKRNQIKKETFWDREISSDQYAEMIVQELFDKRGLVVNMSGLSESDVLFLNERIIPGIKKYAAMLREKIKGKLILVKGTG